MIPQIKYLDVAPSKMDELVFVGVAHQTTIEDDGEIISLYIYPHEQHPARYVCETEELDVLTASADINNKGNLQGIEVILKRR